MVNNNNEYSWNASSIVIYDKIVKLILRDTSSGHACLGEVSRESASRQSRELIMSSDKILYICINSVKNVYVKS